MENISVLRRVFLVFGIALVVIGVLIYLFRSSFEEFNKNSKMVLHTLHVQEKIEELVGVIKDTENGINSFVITDDQSFLNPYYTNQVGVNKQLLELEGLTNDNPIQKKYLDTIQSLVEEKLAIQEFILHLKKSDNFKFGHLEVFKESTSIMDSIRIITNKMKNESNRIRIEGDLEVTAATQNARMLSMIFSMTAICILILSLVTILIEIRNKKKVFDILETVLEASPSGIMSFKAIRDAEAKIIDFEFIQVNANAANLVGRTPENMLKEKLLTVFPTSIKDGFFKSYVEVTDKNIIVKKESYYSNEKFKKWFRIVAVKLNDGFTITFDDISKEKQYEIELNKYIHDLKKSNNELEQFAFVASHDLQEPLRKIQTFGDRLKIKAADSLNEDTIVYIDKMITAANRMSKLIFDLLDFSRLSHIKDPFVKCDLNKIISNIKSDLELVIQNKNAIISSDSLPDVEGVSLHLYQVFYNLIGNALKFSIPGKQSIIQISSELFEKEVLQSKIGQSNLLNQQFVRITVTDNGIGFENEYSNRIFEIFQRLHGRSEFEGTGIGLALCKVIVTNHNGFISAVSIPGQGATFTIELPLTQII